MNEQEFEERKSAMLAMSDPLGLLRYGAAELKRIYNRNLGMALAVSVGVHLLVLLFVLYSNDDPVPTQPREISVRLTPIPSPQQTPMEIVRLDDEGSSGALHSKEPKGPAMRGDRTLSRAPFVQGRGVSSEPPPKDMKPVGSKPVASNNETVTTPPGGPLDRDSANRAQNTGSGSIAGGAGGTGSQGIGGGGTGSPTDGLGSRGWASRPRVSYPSGANTTGVVRLEFTVLPNGEITGIKPRKVASRELVDAAIAALRRARAKPLPESAPQVPQQSWFNVNFVLK